LRSRLLITSYFVDILEGQTKGSVTGALGHIDVVEGIHEGDTVVDLLVGLRYGPSLEPGHLGASLQHVVSVPSRDGYERDDIWIVSDLFDISLDLLLDLLEASLKNKQDKIDHTEKL